MHVLTDGMGNPLGFHLTAGQIHESTVVDEVLMTSNDLTDREGQGIAWLIALSGDKGYRADWIDEYLIDLGIMPAIPSKASEDRSKRPVVFEKDRYRNRNIVERLIGWQRSAVASSLATRSLQRTLVG
jgi:transposase